LYIYNSGGHKPPSTNTLHIMTIATLTPVDASTNLTNAVRHLLLHFGHDVVDTGHCLCVNAYTTEVDVVRFKEERTDIFFEHMARIIGLIPEVEECYYIRVAR
jgi:hypothetical protein